MSEKYLPLKLRATEIDKGKYLYFIADQDGHAITYFFSDRESAERFTLAANHFDEAVEILKYLAENGWNSGISDDAKSFLTKLKEAGYGK